MSVYVTLKLDKHIFSQEDEDGEKFFNEINIRGGMIAGGYLRSLFDDAGYGDIDIFTPNQRSYDDITGYMLGSLNTWPPGKTKYSDHYSIRGLGKQSKEYTLTELFDSTGYKINVIYPVKGAPQPEGLLDRFDFTCVKACAINGNELIVHKDFVEHTAKKELHYNSEVNDLLMYRILKYRGYGYSSQINAMDILKWAYRQLKPNLLAKTVLGHAVNSFPLFKSTFMDLYEKWTENHPIDIKDDSKQEIR